MRPFERRAEIDFALACLTRAPQDQSITMLSDHVGLGPRRFTRLFELQVGMTPKVFARIKRFELMLRRSLEPGLDWSGIAVDCGYFDQSHLIRECRTLSGFTPAELVRRRTGDSHHVAV
jgi:AraC-like DNA-binding protein